MATTDYSVSPVLLHLEPDEEPYDEYPKVGIVARASITVGGSDVTVEITSPGVWHTHEARD